LPFERLVGHQPGAAARHRGFRPLALQNTAEVKLELDGLSCGWRVATSSAKFDLSVSLGEGGRDARLRGVAGW
jgi:hypothetical protein